MRRTITFLVGYRWIRVDDLEFESAQKIAYEMGRNGIQVWWWHPTQEEWMRFVS